MVWPSRWEGGRLSSPVSPHLVRLAEKISHRHGRKGGDEEEKIPNPPFLFIPNPFSCPFGRNPRLVKKVIRSRCAYVAPKPGHRYNGPMYGKHNVHLSRATVLIPCYSNDVIITFMGRPCFWHVMTCESEISPFSRCIFSKLINSPVDRPPGKVHCHHQPFPFGCMMMPEPPLFSFCLRLIAQERVFSSLAVR